ncbi:MAG: hypothetical protein JW384_02273 [Nitrosomonadaceae bacterium]|nr:hypothetical protein [Nitrosomonadaceae bacterium]
MDNECCTILTTIICDKILLADLCKGENIGDSPLRVPHWIRITIDVGDPRNRHTATIALQQKRIIGLPNIRDQLGVAE